MLMAFLLGIGLGNHTTLGLAATPFGIWVLWVVWQQQRWRGVLDWRPAVGLAVGLSIYVYAPIAASAGPIINWGSPNTLESFRWMASATLYQGYAFGIESEYVSNRISRTAELLFTQYTIVGTVTGIAGLTTMWAYSRGFAYASVSSIVAIALYSVAYSTADSFIYLISVFMVFSLWIGVGIALLGIQIRRLVAKTPRFAVYQMQVHIAVFLAVSLVIPVWSVSSGWDEINISDQSDPAELAERSIAVASGGVLLVEEPELFAFVYQSQVANPELDVMVVGPAMLQYDWYWESLVKYYGDRISAEKPAAFTARVGAVVGHNLGLVPVYAVTDDRYYYDQFNMVLVGDLFKIEF